MNMIPDLIMQKLAHPPSIMVVRGLKDFAVVNDELYYRGGGSVMARALSRPKLKKICNASRNSHAENIMSTSIDACRDKGPTGPKWAKKSPSYIPSAHCDKDLETRESLFIQLSGDWRQPNLDILLYRLLLKKYLDAMKIKRKSLRFFVEDGYLFRRGINQASLQCNTSSEVTRVLQEIHAGNCCNHQAGSRVYQ